jgi:hypothetical protein
VAQPELGALTDPAFDPLPGAPADFGRLGGSIYQIEIPTRWNGRLVLWMHGFGELAMRDTSCGVASVRAGVFAARSGTSWGPTRSPGVAPARRSPSGSTASRWQRPG